MVRKSNSRWYHFSTWVSLAHCSLFVALVSLSSQSVAQFSAPVNLDPGAASIRLDASFQDDAWLVYRYDISADGLPHNIEILSSNGVSAVEQAVTEQINSLRFKPAMRSGVPVSVSADPVIFTWILDLPREMSIAFSDLYREAWAHYSQKNYDAVFAIADQLKNYPGRNAYEEVKYQVLAASLASRQEDSRAELLHLSKAIEFQNLALSNDFGHTYLPKRQHLMVLSRIQTLQLRKRMLADAGSTLAQIQSLSAGSEVAKKAEASYRKSELAFRNEPNVAVTGELVPVFPGGPGSWKTGLSRSQFSISDVTGRIGAVYLVCGDRERSLRYPARDVWSVPAGWSDCKIDVSGKANTQFLLHQHASAQ